MTLNDFVSKMSQSGSGCESNCAILICNFLICYVTDCYCAIYLLWSESDCDVLGIGYLIVVYLVVLVVYLLRSPPCSFSFPEAS